MFSILRNCFYHHSRLASKIRRTLFVTSSLVLLCMVTACGAPVSQMKPSAEVTVDPSFQKKITPPPAVPTYRCGSWASNNVPGTYSTISIYARLMSKELKGVPGASASAVVHLKTTDLTLDEQPSSDEGGYVKFTLSLQGRQPKGEPATVDVAFKVNNKKVQCSQAFFTPQ